MELSFVALMTAFSAGVISFLSPCVLAVLPSCTAFLGSTGKSVNIPYLRPLWVNIAIFLSGFVAVFLLIGIGASYLGQALHNYQHVMSKVGAVFMMVMGLQLSSLISFAVPFRKIHLRFPSSAGPGGIFLLGVASTATWTPCNTPFLAPIFLYASTSPSLTKGFLLFFVYALGFCLPFSVLALTLDRFVSRLRLVSNKMHIVQHIAGMLLCISGILIFFDLLE